MKQYYIKSPVFSYTSTLLLKKPKDKEMKKKHNNFVNLHIQDIKTSFAKQNEYIKIIDGDYE